MRNVRSDAVPPPFPAPSGGAPCPTQAVVECPARDRPATGSGVAEPGDARPSSAAARAAGGGA